ncbi:hypothetical protein OROMI_030422 [Orobanche minor]
MGQQPLIYSFVARGTVILAEFTEFSGNFIGIAAQCLQKLPTTNYKFTYKCDGHTFNYLVEDGFTLMCIMPQKVTGRNWLSKYTKLLFLYLSMSTNTSASFSDLMLLLCCTIFGGTYDDVWYDTAAFVE